MKSLKRKCVIFFVFSVLSSFIIASYQIHRALYLQPQFKFGKIENGVGFSEIQYVKFQYDISDKYTFSGGLSTGFTSPRSNIWAMNHAVNRLGIKFTYRPFDRLGFFFEGSFTDKISGSENYASYFVYDTYQAIGFNWDIRTIDLTF